ncbi:polyprenyl synthetase family protein [uncultured Levyella sp.]|uniref:polyprenyl synthetase family protein n=1 Tax=uncultured Levyella sp. TaxID=1715800 RepID=UPI00258BF31F|nr:polyprenyl synthetase family protein [uncultured Levyella sp.]
MRIEDWLQEVFLPRLRGRLEAIRALDSMFYATDGGKRLRPQMVFAAASAIQEPTSHLPWFSAMTDAACALEMIHAHSLIHDDMPCMDNDRYRRGKLTVHAAYGEAEALLSGDALLNGAYIVLFNAMDEADASLSQRISRAGTLLSRHVGLEGMLGGQVLDMHPISHDRQAIQAMVEKKTSALFSAACGMGCILAGGNERHVNDAVRFGNLFGLLFQLNDDEDDRQQDEKEGKYTYWQALREENNDMRTVLFDLAAQRAKALPHGERLLTLLQGVSTEN